MQKGKIGREKRDKIIVEGWVNRKWVGICSSNITSCCFTLILGENDFHTNPSILSNFELNRGKWESWNPFYLVNKEFIFSSKGEGVFMETNVE